VISADSRATEPSLALRRERTLAQSNELVSKPFAARCDLGVEAHHDAIVLLSLANPLRADRILFPPPSCVTPQPRSDFAVMFVGAS